MVKTTDNTETPEMQTVQKGVPQEADEANTPSWKLWKLRYETSVTCWKDSDHKQRYERMVNYLHNDFNEDYSDIEEAFFNQYFISLKTLIPMVIANNPFVGVSADNDYVFEYGKDGLPIKDMNGNPIKHDITMVAKSIQGLVKNRFKNVVDIKAEMRDFLCNAIAFNRGIFLTGHTVNSEYSGAFNQPAFHAYIKSIAPNKIKRQAGTATIEEGTYCFYEYELPMSHLKGNKAYNQALLAKCTPEVLSDVKIDKDNAEYKENDKQGLYDDVKFLKMRNGYDFLTGEIHIFGKGCDEALRTVTPKYGFKNPFEEFIPNKSFQPDQNEPRSDLMMIENLVNKAQEIIDKSIRHVKNFNSGFIVERNAITSAQKKKIENSDDLSVWEVEPQTVSGGKMKPRESVALGAEPFNLIQFIFSYVEKTLAVYNFQQGGADIGADETATKTQAKVQTSQFKTGDMSDMFRDACNKILKKYVEVLIRNTTNAEMVQCIGDAGEVEYIPFEHDKAMLGVGQYYCTIDLQSMGKQNQDVQTQQALKFIEILKGDPDPVIQKAFNKLAVYKKAATGLGMDSEGIILKNPDTQGMSRQDYMKFMKGQMLKAKQETEQGVAGARIFPPSPDDDDDLHLDDHLPKAEEIKKQMADLQASGQPVPPELQRALDSLLQHSQLHVQQKAEKDKQAQLINPGSVEPKPSQAPAQVKVANQPPNPGQMLGQAQTVGGMQ